MRPPELWQLTRPELRQPLLQLLKQLVPMSCLAGHAPLQAMQVCAAQQCTALCIAAAL